MKREKRAAQFAPFSALTGHEEAVEYNSKVLEEKRVLSESYREGLDRKLNYVINNYKTCVNITITYFLRVNDNKKHIGDYNKGVYITYSGRLKSCYENKRLLEFEDGKKISLDDIFAIRIEKSDE